MRKSTRKTTESKTKLDDQQKSATPSVPVPSPVDDQKDETNYGGLPNLNLKKNLGCG